jgi:ATP-dependent exoDNAse (exonuclease V) beta subunit
MSIEKELQVFDRISFVEKDHTYYIDGVLNSVPSVTRVLKQFKKKFDVDEAAARVAKRQGTTIDYIKAEWEMNNLYSTTIGSMFHKYVENFYTKQDIPFEGNYTLLGFEEREKIKTNLPILVSYFEEFHKNHSNYECLKNEFVVGDIDDTKICGMLDMLAVNSDNQSLELWDFKTNKKIGHSSYGYLFYPFDDMTEGQINEYTIQLNTYKHFIEKYTNLKVDKMKIIWFNVVNTSYQIFELPDIQTKIVQMLERYKANSLFAEG